MPYVVLRLGIFAEAASLLAVGREIGAAAVGRLAQGVGATEMAEGVAALHRSAPLAGEDAAGTEERADRADRADDEEDVEKGHRSGSIARGDGLRMMRVIARVKDEYGSLPLFCFR